MMNRCEVSGIQELKECLLRMSSVLSVEQLSIVGNQYIH